MKKKRSFLEIVGIIALVALVAFLINDIIELVKKAMKSKSDLNETAVKHVASKKQRRKEMVEDTLNRNMDLFEERMVDHGAVQMEEFDAKNRERFGTRPIFEYNGNYFRIGSLTFDEGEDPYIIVNAIDNERFAKIGVMEEIEAYPFDMPEARIDEVVGEFLESEL